MRRSGILMPVSSLASDYGIGTFGADAYRFVDFLHKAGQQFWQILPLGPTSYGDSPYQSFSTFAGNPYFIDLTMLIDEGLLTQEEVENHQWGESKEQVDYSRLYQERYPVLRIAYQNFITRDQSGFEAFRKENESWLKDYALFMSLKEENQNRSWQEWPEELKRRDIQAIQCKEAELMEEIAFWSFLQYLFYEQWSALKAYANEKGVQIIGDIPIYVALDSSDVWKNPEEFDLDENYKPSQVAGCPPDAFALTGQLWGNPLYRWDKMKENGYQWWMERIGHAAAIYDVVRIDHFRGFDSYYAIPGQDETAEHGTWLTGPGMDLFSEVNRQFGEVKIIAEDLGFMTDSVRELLKATGYPGMKILQFGFNPEAADSVDQPHNYPKNCVAYTGTHDNSTIMGWLSSCDKSTKEHAMAYLDTATEEEFNWTIIKRLMASVSDTVIIPMQDYLGLDDSARINIPATTSGNWQWRCCGNKINDELAEKIYQISACYQRVFVRNGSQETN